MHIGDPDFKRLEAFLIFSIKKAVEEAYKDIEMEKVDTETLPSSIDIDFETLQLMRRDMQQFGNGYNEALSLIEKKKSLFLNK